MVEAANPARLTAVLALNIADFDIYEKSDRNAVRRMLPAYLDIIREQVGENRGRLFRAQKDSFMAEFASPVSAGRAAMGILADIAEYNDDQAQHLRMQFCMGVHVGPSTGSGRDLGGEAVNVAESLRDIAEPGAICFSDLAYEQSAGRVELEFEELGERDLPGSAKPINVFKGVDGLDMYANATGGGGLAGALSFRTIAFVSLGVVVSVFAVLYGWQEFGKRLTTSGGPQQRGAAVQLFDKPFENPFGRQSGENLGPDGKPRQQSDVATADMLRNDGNGGGTPLTLPAEPSIAVLPVVNLMREADQAYLSASLAEEIAAGLSLTSRLFVAAPHSSLLLDGAATNAARAGRQLGVRFVLASSVSRVNDRYRFAFQLLDGASEAPVWTKVAERDARDLSSLKREVAAELATVMRMPMQPEEGLRLRRRETANGQAYELYLRGIDSLRGGRPENLQAALRFFARSSETDARFAPAFEGLAVAHFQIQQSSGEAAGLAPAQRAAEQALALDDSLPGARSVLARALAAQRQFDRAIAEAERVTQMAPSYADGHAHLANILVWSGAPEAAVPRLQRAMRLNPSAPSWYYFGMGHAQFLLQQYDNATAAFRRALQLNPDWAAGRVYLAAAYAQGNKRDMAQFELQRPEIRAVLPAFMGGEQAPYRNPESLALLQDALRKAGVPR